MEYLEERLNGERVGKFLIDRYLNSYCLEHDTFMEAMSMEKKEVKENFTYLIFAWLKALESVSFYDLRNEASVLLACDLCGHVQEEPVIHVMTEKEDIEVEWDSYEDTHVESVMAEYLVAGSKSKYREFIDYALRTHRTLQQNLTRFFMEWIRKEKKSSFLLQNANLLLETHTLPYI